MSLVDLAGVFGLQNFRSGPFLSFPKFLNQFGSHSEREIHKYIGHIYPYLSLVLVLKIGHQSEILRAVFEEVFDFGVKVS